MFASLTGPDIILENIKISEEALMDYVDLHVHTEFTQGNALTKICELTQKAAELGMPALAITDTASVSGFVDFAAACREANIRPVFGCGFYLTTGSRFDYLDEKYHIVLLAKDDFGFANLLRLLAHAYEEGFHKRPRIDLEILSEYSRGLICLTGGLGGIIDKKVLGGDRAAGRTWIRKFRSIFTSENLYLEVQNNNLQENRTMLQEHKHFAKRFELNFVATGGSFYLSPDEAQACNRLRKKSGNGTLSGEGYHFRSPEEMAKIFKNSPDALSNSLVIAEACNVTADITGCKHVGKEPRERLYELMRHCNIEH